MSDAIIPLPLFQPFLMSDRRKLTCHSLSDEVFYLEKCPDLKLCFCEISECLIWYPSLAKKAWVEKKRKKRREGKHGGPLADRCCLIKKNRTPKGWWAFHISDL